MAPRRLWIKRLAASSVKNPRIYRSLISHSTYIATLWNSRLNLLTLSIASTWLQTVKLIALMMPSKRLLTAPWLPERLVCWFPQCKTVYTRRISARWVSLLGQEAQLSYSVRPSTRVLWQSSCWLFPAAMGGTYEFTKYASANLREKNDSYNSAIGGFLAGSVLGLRCKHLQKRLAHQLMLIHYQLERHLRFLDSVLWQLLCSVYSIILAVLLQDTRKVHK